MSHEGPLSLHSYFGVLGKIDQDLGLNALPCLFWSKTVTEWDAYEKGDPSELCRRKATCGGCSWLATWLCLKWTTTQKWRAYLWEVFLSGLKKVNLLIVRTFEIGRQRNFDLGFKSGRHRRLIWILRWKNIPWMWAIPSTGSLYEDIQPCRTEQLLDSWAFPSTASHGWTIRTAACKSFQ